MLLAHLTPRRLQGSPGAVACRWLFSESSSPNLGRLPVRCRTSHCRHAAACRHLSTPSGQITAEEIAVFKRQIVGADVRACARIIDVSRGRSRDRRRERVLPTAGVEPVVPEMADRLARPPSRWRGRTPPPRRSFALWSRLPITRRNRAAPSTAAWRQRSSTDVLRPKGRGHNNGGVRAGDHAIAPGEAVAACRDFFKPCRGKTARVLIRAKEASWRCCRSWCCQGRCSARTPRRMTAHRYPASW